MSRIAYNTDVFSKEFQEDIVNIWKKDHSAEITVRGTGRKAFLEWIKENYPEAKEEGDYFVLTTEK